MKIVVQKHIPFVIYVPNRLLCSRFGAFVISEAICRDGISADRAQLASLLRQCSSIFAQHRGLTFVEIFAGDGTQIKITL